MNNRFKPIPPAEVSKDLVREFFGEPVFTYTDQQACEDGVLVALDRNSHDRCTRAVFDYLVEHTPLDAKPPDNWPVTLLAWFRSATLPESVKRDIRARSLAFGAIGKFETQARKVYAENIGGGILCLWATLGRATDTLYALCEKEPVGDRCPKCQPETGRLGPGDYCKDCKAKALALGLVWSDYHGNFVEPEQLQRALALDQPQGA